MKKIFFVVMFGLFVAGAAFGQASPEKYVGQYQVTGAPIMITVTASGGKLAIEATGQGQAEIELIAGEDYGVKGTPITLTFQKDAAGKVTGMIIHQSPTLDVPAPKINSSSEAPSDKSPHKSAFVTANGIRMNYLDWGGTGDVVILLAGLGNDAHVFDEIAPSFTDKFHVIGLTRRGFGETDRPAKGYETTTRVEDIGAFMDAMKITRAHLVGHSLAGDEMTLFAATYPQRVIKMVYLDAAYDRRRNFSCVNDQPGGGLPPAFLRIVGEAMNCPGWEKIVAPDMPPPDMVNVQVSTMRAAMQFVPDYKKITAPSLAIYADVDIPESPAKLDEETTKKRAAWWKEHEAPKARASIEQFRESMKNGQVVEIKGATHYVFVGPYKDRVVTLVRDFLDTKVISALDVEYRTQIYKDPRFSVFLLEIPPDHASLMHRHDTDMLSVFVSGGVTKSTIFGKPPAPDSFRAGDVRYRVAGFTHATENTGTTMFRAVILEFNSPAGEANADKPPDLHYCKAGAPTTCVDEKYLFCAAKFCVEDISIASGATWSSREFAHDQMMIAVSDYDLSYKQAGKTSNTRPRKSGQADFLGGGPKREWTNKGLSPAHVVSVIFH